MDIKKIMEEVTKETGVEVRCLEINNVKKEDCENLIKSLIKEDFKEFKRPKFEININQNKGSFEGSKMDLCVGLAALIDSLISSGIEEKLIRDSLEVGINVNKSGGKSNVRR